MRRTIIALSLMLIFAVPASAQHVMHLPTVNNGAQQAVIAATITSVTSGAWHSGSTWSSGSVPTSADNVGIGHLVTLSAAANVAGVTIDPGGVLRFDPDITLTLHSTDNVIVYGALDMQPANAATTHTLRFTDINESNFVGGGMVPIASDVGLWVMCTQDVPGQYMVMCDPNSAGGTLALAGTSKTAWTRAAGTVALGATQITVQDATGWLVGDELSITPTEHPNGSGNAAWNGFDVATITAIDGTTVTLNTPTTRAHPAVANPFDANIIYTAEVLNLTRNVRIEGTGNGEAALSGNGRAHIFIRSTQPQSIRYAQFRYLGPRKPDGNYTKAITGRYGLHFHHNEDASRGTLLEGVVVRDTGSHAYAPHASHGITLQDTISYNTFGDAYWWDGPPCDHCGDEEFINNTDDLTIDHAVAAIVRNDPSFRGTRLSAYTLREGEHLSLTLRNSIAVGVQGNGDAAGYNWPEFGHAVWVFANNLAHNNKVDGIFVWQNDQEPHQIHNFTAYHNGGHGIDHGAYANAYQYFDVDLFGNGDDDLNSRAASRTQQRADGYGQAFERVRLAGTFRIGEHTLDFSQPTLVIDCIMAGVHLDEDVNPNVFDNKDRPGKYDFVHCVKPDGSNLLSTDFDFFETQPNTTLRVQHLDGTAYQIVVDAAYQPVVSTIAPFYTFGAPPTPTPTPTPLPVQPDAYWTMDETSGARLDSIGSSHLVENNPIAYAAGQFGNAVDFNAAQSEILSVANNAAIQTGDVTFYAALWVNADVLGTTNKWILTKWSATAGEQEFLLRYNGTSKRFEWFWYTGSGTNVNLTADTLGEPTIDTWYFIEVWRDADTDTAGIAVNRGADDTIGGANNGVASSQSLEIGGDSSKTTQTFDGSVDELYYRKGSIPTAAQRDELYTEGF